MPSIRQYYFENINKIEASSNISRTQFLHLICKFNNLKNEAELLMHFDDEMKAKNEVNLIIDKVIKGEMLEYLINEAFFYDDFYYVNSHVLIPRQETEELVHYFCKYVDKIGSNLDIADICTGSGCIAVALSKHCSINNLYASDVSKEALNVAKINSDKYNANINFLEGNITDPFIKNNIKVDCIICNPPYIKDSSTIDKRTWEYEPHLALISDPDTYFYEYVLKNATTMLNKKHLIAFEIGEDMKEALDILSRKYLPYDKIDFIKDMDGKWRFMFIYTDFEEISSKAAKTLENHGVIAFPTETVMGLGVAYDDVEAFKKLNKIKGRPENKPYSLMLGDTNCISNYAYISEEEQKVINAFLPGPLTILLKKKELPEWVTLGSEYVGIRVPDIELIKTAINKLGKPILAPSANISGNPPALTSEEVHVIFGDLIDYVIEGDAENSVASTIVLINNGVNIIRQGKITKQQIEEVLKQ